MPKAHPALDEQKIVEIEFDGMTLQVKKSFKIFKFLKLVKEDAIAAISLALTDESLETLEEKEMTMEQFDALMNEVAETLSGVRLGN